MPVEVIKKGVDPLDPDVVRDMRQKREEIASKYPTKGDVSELDDLCDQMTIAGFQCRPLSAGIFAILLNAGSPLMNGGEEKADHADEIDYLVFLFLLLSDKSVAELVDIAKAGYDALRQETIIWSFGITLPDMANLMREIPVVFSRFQGMMNLYADTAGGDGEKK